MIRRIPLLMLWLILSTTNVSAQIEAVDSIALTDDRFIAIQNKLEGCWTTKSIQFSYNKAQNFGHEYKSPVHSSAPFFKLEMRNEKIYLVWYELLGGDIPQRIVNIGKNKLKLETESGYKVVYKRNKGYHENRAGKQPNRAYRV